MSCTNRMEHLCPFTRINDAIKITIFVFYNWKCNIAIFRITFRFLKS